MRQKKNEREGPQDAPGAIRASGTGPRLSIRCTAAWATWLDGLARHCELTQADTISQALRRFGDQVGYHHPAPFRVDRPRLAELSQRAEEARFYGPTAQAD